MDKNRRFLLAALLIAPLVPASWFWRSAERRNLSSWSSQTLSIVSDTMRYRVLGKSGIKVSEVSFGGLQIARQAGTDAGRAETMRALATAEELGCNLVDTSSVYGDSELLIGDFMPGRRDRWLISTKYSGQRIGLEATLENQLRRLRTDAVDLYMIHWAPSPDSEHELYEALYRVQKAGKTRLVGVSLYNIGDIRTVLRQTDIDVFMVPFNFLSPDPFVGSLDIIRTKQPAVLVRTSLYGGLLTGKYGRDKQFTDPVDQRSSWTPEIVADTVDMLQSFKFLENVAESLTLAATRYPLAWNEVSSVVVGTRTLSQAEENFSRISNDRLSAETLQRIQKLQRALDLFDRRGRLKDGILRLLG